MRTFYPFAVNDIEAFKLRLLYLSEKATHFCLLDSNNYPNYPHASINSIVAIDAIEIFCENNNGLSKFQDFQQRHKDWIFGYLSYDLKNEIENLKVVQKSDALAFPLLQFFIPKFIFKFYTNSIEIGVTDDAHIAEFTQLLSQAKTPENMGTPKVSIQKRNTKEDYIATVEKIKSHIRNGDIYEMNFCQEYYATDVEIEPTRTFQKLNNATKAPFASFYKSKDHYLLCSSPERFIKRQNNQLISQPIKGTRKRLADTHLDNKLKNELSTDTKERSENVMIVDLVRNDLSKVAISGSVKVEELCGIYTFEQVHQMISTISCAILNERTFTEITKATFPMGSMTGAPKIAAMQFIEELESFKRGLYSGAIGYITPDGNFDFNVVIRSILYNKKNKYLAIHAGSAITAESDAVKEYDECLLKANAMLQALQ
ncbi:MAG TPA: anthranilate synthase component I family protein [Chitinophagales bacterium]|jgi:para-aminobenzoate synthetase component 1|nr:anthranilate synthase component I family protein [Chitinophagales bacterium]HQG37555.1 anthranilate synthase component I family protein [Chitinophagales bacterium]